MSWTGACQLAVVAVLLLAVTPPLGAYMARVFEGERTFLSGPLRRVESLLYKLGGVDPATEQSWTAYTGACLAFGLVNCLLFYGLLRLQGWLPLNPNRFGTGMAPSGSVPLTPDLAFNTAVSFMTNTSWQSYPPETTLGYIVQMLGVAVQSFTSAAAGIAVAVALIRGFVRRGVRGLGNFWADVTRATLYLLVPLAFLAALFLCSQGVIQNFQAYQQATTIEGAKQTIALGPVASQESIKLLSSDGGGFFNASSAHPFENPTPLTNLVEMLLMLAIPAGLTYTFGRMVKDQHQGWALFVAMLLLFLCGGLVAGWSEQRGTSGLQTAGINERPSASNPGGNMEGKEVRFGIAGAALFSVAGTASADGAMNSAHDSYTPIAGLVQLLNLKTGEVIFGGVGSGLISMLLMVLVTVFIAGLMVGRTPEYLGKKIEGKEMKLVMVSLVAGAAAILLFSGATLLARFPASSYWNPQGSPLANLTNAGPHGLSEVLYANASAVATNGSAFSGMNANTPWFNLTLGLEMLIGRFFVIIPALAIAGSLARKRRLAATSGTLPTRGPLFVVLLVGSIMVITVLTFLPTLSLGPIAEHFLMSSGALFH